MLRVSYSVLVFVFVFDLFVVVVVEVVEVVVEKSFVAVVPLIATVRVAVAVAVAAVLKPDTPMIGIEETAAEAKRRSMIVAAVVVDMRLLLFSFILCSCLF